MDYSSLISQDLRIAAEKVAAALALFDDGCTVPFIARYRKDRTGNLDEIQLRDVQHRYEYFKELADRKQTMVSTIQEQGKMTPELMAQIEACLDRNVLEDIYLPYKPKRRTKATTARENGLEPLAELIWKQEPSTNTAEEIGRIYLNPDKGIGAPEAAIQGALDILAERIAETAEYRQRIREHAEREGKLVSKVRKEFEIKLGEDGQPVPGSKRTKFETYYDFSERVATIPSHRVLAIRRGEKEKVLRLSIEMDDARMVSALKAHVITGETIWSPWLEKCCEDAYERLIKPQIETEVRLLTKERAEKEAFAVFSQNLRNLLLAAPAGHRGVLAIDPGFRTGCKVAVLDKNGKFLDHAVIFPTAPQNDFAGAAKVVRDLVEKYGLEMVAIGNGTASRETEAFVAKAFAGRENAPHRVVVSESGASVYSASDEAIREFPNEDVTTRGAISIGRRLQDPLAELVKVEPQAIGVGQYQHDVNQAELKKSLDEVVESCVNSVGVDLNTASAPLLSYVAGVSRPVASAIVKHREENGAFKTRKALLEVPKFGPKAFEQAAGFLRVIDGENPLDGSAVHPENYALVEKMAADLGMPVAQLLRNRDAIAKIKPEDYVSETAGSHTVEDILAELEKPNRDPRSEFRYAHFDDKIQTLQDLVTGSWMEGVVTNVTQFGAFVDIGVHQDGLVHISEIGEKFVKNAMDVLKVGEVVRVRVKAVDPAQKRISLSMRNPDESERHDRGFRGHGDRPGFHGRPGSFHGRPKDDPKLRPTATIADLKAHLKGKDERPNRPVQAARPVISIKSLMRKGR